MDIRKLQKIVVQALDGVKAQNIEVYNTQAISTEFERVIIACGTSNRHTRALVHHVRTAVKEAGGTVFASEGEDTGDWVLLDLGQAVVHVMLPAIRDYYRLEEIWGAKRAHIKLSVPETAKKPAALYV